MNSIWDRYRDKRIVYQSAVRAARYGAEGSFTLEEWLDICKQHENKCTVCNIEKPLSADHIVPLSRGGTNFINNIQPLCRSCNTRKHNKLPGEEHSPTQFLPKQQKAPIDKISSKREDDWGGKRTGAGRLQQVFHLSRESARQLQDILSYRRLSCPELTEEELLDELIRESGTS